MIELQHDDGGKEDNEEDTETENIEARQDDKKKRKRKQTDNEKILDIEQSKLKVLTEICNHLKDISDVLRKNKDPLL